MDDKKFIANLINNAQQRFVWYKAQLMEVHKNMDVYPQWYLNELKELRTREANWLKGLQEEAYWIGQGMDNIKK
jgi:hypothetical protein